MSEHAPAAAVAAAAAPAAGATEGLGTAISKSIGGAANKLYNTAIQPLGGSIFGPRKNAAQSTGFLRGDLVKSAQDATFGALIANPLERVKDFTTDITEVSNNIGQQVYLALGTPITSPGALVKNLATTPVVLLNEMTAGVNSLIRRTVELPIGLYEGMIGRPVDRISVQIREKLKHIPGGGIVGGILSGGLNLTNKMISLPASIINSTSAAVYNVVRKGNNWVRGKMPGGSAEVHHSPSAPAAAPAAAPKAEEHHENPHH